VLGFLCSKESRFIVIWNTLMVVFWANHRGCLTGGLFFRDVLMQVFSENTQRCC